jgi:hypothetical protein
VYTRKPLIVSTAANRRNSLTAPRNPNPFTCRRTCPFGRIRLRFVFQHVFHVPSSCSRFPHVTAFMRPSPPPRDRPRNVFATRSRSYRIVVQYSGRAVHDLFRTGPEFGPKVRKNRVDRADGGPRVQREKVTGRCARVYVTRRRERNPTLRAWKTVSKMRDGPISKTARFVRFHRFLLFVFENRHDRQQKIATDAHRLEKSYFFFFISFNYFSLRITFSVILYFYRADCNIKCSAKPISHPLSIHAVADSAQNNTNAVSTRTFYLITWTLSV